jgi:hypothetical protein
MLVVVTLPHSPCTPSTNYAHLASNCLNSSVDYGNTFTNCTNFSIDCTNKYNDYTNNLHVWANISIDFDDTIDRLSSNVCIQNS